jgi:WD40 repeat protein
LMPEPASSTTPPPVPGHELLRCIGRGSYGEVWLAREAAGGEYRAVKVVYRKTFEHERPFERELSGIRKFEPISRTHPSQVSILQVGLNQAEGYFFYVMELADSVPSFECRVPGSIPPNQLGTRNVEPETYSPRTLKSELAGRGRLSFRECLDIGMALATALEHLHQHGLIHRDIKPSNVIFVRGVPKLADIGLVTDADATISFVGTEGFLPPEGPGTPTADIYSLGKVLYEISTGRDRMDFPELPTFAEEAADNERLLELNAVVLKACQNDPRRRYQSAREMLADLTLLQSGRSLRRAHALEQRLVTARRLAATGILVILAAALGNHFMQQQRLRRAQKDKALQELKASWAQGVATEKGHKLADVYADKGATLEAEGDYFGALLSFARALRDEQDDPSRAAGRRADIETLWQKCPALSALFAHTGGVNSAAFGADGRRIITAGDDHIAQVWNADSGEPIGEPLRHSNRVVHAELSADGEQALTVSADGGCQLWMHPGGTGASATKLQLAGSVRQTKFSPNGRQFLTVGDGPDVLLWETSSQRPRFTLKHAEPVTDAVFSPDGRYIATASADRTTRVWLTGTGEALGPPSPHDENVSGVSFSPDSRRLVSTSGSKARVCVARSGELASFTLRHDAAIQSVCFSPDGKRLLTASEDQTARVWDAVNGQAIGAPLRHREAVHIAAFNPDGRFIATVSGTRVSLWDARGLRMIPPAWVHNAVVRDIHFSPAGHELLTASADGTARLIRLDTIKNGTSTLRSSTASEDPVRSEPFDDAVWMSWAQLLSGRQVSSREQITPVPADALRTLWQSLKVRFPREFDPWDTLRWHRQAAESSEQSADWFGARFHWERALRLAPGEEQFRVGREQAEHELARLEGATGRHPEIRIPARAATVRSQLLDLSEYYNAALTETWLPTGGVTSGNDLSALPSGIQKFGGIEFDVRGIIQLSGGAVENAGGTFPRRINALPVGQPCRRIHFLHGAAWSALSGTHVGSYVVRYASGESREVKIIFGQNVREWLAVPAPQLTTAAAVAWEGANAASRALGLSVRLYQVTWKNPLPDVDVQEIDFKSTMENPAPFLIAITVE